MKIMSAAVTLIFGLAIMLAVLVAMVGWPG